ncbi:hypothetical protein ACFL15_02215 [Patescibacteria group bacterium]
MELIYAVFIFFLVFGVGAYLPTLIFKKLTKNIFPSKTENIWFTVGAILCFIITLLFFSQGKSLIFPTQMQNSKKFFIYIDFGTLFAGMTLGFLFLTKLFKF